MESEGTSSTTHAPGAVLGEPDAGPGCASLELPRADPGKLQGLPLGPRAHGKDPDLGSPGTPTTSGDGPLDLGPSGGPNGGAKLPNRDSGIDSPSCSVVSEQFPCEEGGEASRGPAVLGHLEAAPEGEAVREAADSNVGEGNGEEPDPKSSPLRAPVDPVKVGRPPVLGWPGLLSGVVMLWLHQLHLVSVTGVHQHTGEAWQLGGREGRALAPQAMTSLPSLGDRPHGAPALAAVGVEVSAHRTTTTRSTVLATHLTEPL